MAVGATEVTTTSGKTYTGVSISRLNPESVRIMHSGGIVEIDFNDLTAESASVLGITLPERPKTPEPDRNKQLLEEVRSSVRTISTLNGKQYSSDELDRIDPDGLRFKTESGIAKVPFEMLPPDIRQLCKYSAEGATSYRKKKELEEAEAREYREQFYQASSVVESSEFEAKLRPRQKVRAGWICDVAERDVRYVDVVTGESRSSLTGSRRVYTESQEVDLSKFDGKALLWGLDTAVAHGHTAAGTTFSRHVFAVGMYRYVTLDGSIMEVPILHTDKKLAIQHLMQNGLSVIDDESMGEGDLDPNAEPSEVSGTGFLVSTEGHVLTNFHVIDDATQIRVEHRGESFVATVLGTDEELDVAMLKIATSSEGFLRIRDSDSVRLGDDVFTIGYPRPELQGSSPKFTEGSISGLQGFENTSEQFQISVPIQPGNSGGPLISESGEVVGVVVSTLNALYALETGQGLPQNVNYAIKSTHVLRFIEDLSVFSSKLHGQSVYSTRRPRSEIIADAESSIVSIVSKIERP